MTKKKETSAEKHAREVARPNIQEKAEMIIGKLREERYSSETIWDIGRKVSKIVFPHVGWKQRLGKIPGQGNPSKVKNTGSHFSSDDSLPPIALIQECFPPFLKEDKPVEIGTEVYDGSRYLGTVYAILINKFGMVSGYRLKKTIRLTPDHIYPEHELSSGIIKDYKEEKGE